MNNENEIKIGISTRGYRPYSYMDNNNNMHVLGGIVFYSKGEELHRIDRGWLEYINEFNPTQDREKQSLPSERDIKAIFLNSIPKRANKLNLDRTDNFIIKDKERRGSYVSEPKNYLYIYVESSQIEDLGEYLSLEVETERSYKRVLKLTGFKYEFEQYKYNKKEDKLTYYPVTDTKPFFVSKQYYSKQIRTELGQKVDKLRSQFKELNIDIDSYEIEKILNQFEIVPKDGE